MFLWFNCAIDSEISFSWIICEKRRTKKEKEREKMKKELLTYDDSSYYYATGPVMPQAMPNAQHLHHFNGLDETFFQLQGKNFYNRSTKDSYLAGRNMWTASIRNRRVKIWNELKRNISNWNWSTPTVNKCRPFGFRLSNPELSLQFSCVCEIERVVEFACFRCWSKTFRNSIYTPLF